MKLFYSELLKLKNTPVYLIYVGGLLIGIITFTLYLNLYWTNGIMNNLNFMLSLCFIVYPMLISIQSNICRSIEKNASNYQNLLLYKNGATLWNLKTLSLYLGGFFSNFILWMVLGVIFNKSISDFFV